MSSPASRSSSLASAAPSTGRIEFLSQYKGFLAVLVVLIHTGISYGAVGGWPFSEEHDVLWLKVLATCIGSFSQSFVLGAFFFVSSYFLPRTLEKKGPARFFADRLLRLDIPYVLYYFLVMPFLVTIAERAKGNPIPFGPNFGSGPLWFIEALFLFSLVYLAVKLIRGKARPPLLPRGLPRGLPSRALIVVYILAAGIKAGNEGWLEKAAEMRIGAWIALAVGCLLAYLPIMVLGGALTNEAKPFLAA